MIAAETTRTAAIIFPCRHLVEHDVSRGTHLGAAAAVGADVVVDSEFLVANHETVEVGSDDVAHGPGRQPQRKLTVAHLPLPDDV